MIAFSWSFFLKFDNYYEACTTIIKSGGDTDTNSAILGALYGAKYGLKHFSEYHIKNVENSDKLIVLDSQLFNRSNSSYFSRWYICLHEKNIKWFASYRRLQII